MRARRWRPCRRSIDVQTEPLESRCLLTDVTLTLFANREQIEIPANIGVSGGTLLSPVHTEDTSGTLHLDPIPGEPPADVTLGLFFETWRTSAGDAGNNLDAIFNSGQLLTNSADAEKIIQVFVNGHVNREYESRVLQDSDEIVIVFGSDPVVSMNTNFGPIVAEFFPTDTPRTVDNFFNYVNRDDYINAVFHRSVTKSNGEHFVVQGFGFTTDSTTFSSVAQFLQIDSDDPILNEPGIPNTRGTIAMAKIGPPFGTDPTFQTINSATNQVFVSTSDNRDKLDNQNGGFTVFGHVLNMRTVDEIAALPVNSGNPPPFNDLPVSDTNELAVVLSVEGQGTIKGVRFEDTDFNARLNAGDQPVAGATIYIDANDNQMRDDGEQSTETDAAGRYRFDLDPGTYMVCAELPIDRTLSVPFNLNCYMVTVETGRTEADCDFGAVDAGTDFYFAIEDTPRVVDALAGVLNNDEGTGLRASIDEQAANGMVVLAADGSFTYTPNPDFFGVDSFSYIATNGVAGDPIRVLISVENTTDNPQAVSDSFEVGRNSVATSLDVLANDTSKPDGDQPLTVTQVTQGNFGGTTFVSGTGDAIFYSPPSGFVGTETFSYTMRDSDGLTSSAMATVSVATGTFSGFVYHDANANGERDAGEGGIAGVLVELTRPDTGNQNVLQSFITGRDGRWTFENLDFGIYTVSETQPAFLADGSEDTTLDGPTVGSDTFSNVSVDSATLVQEFNFGEGALSPELLSIVWFFASSATEAFARAVAAESANDGGNMPLAEQILAGTTLIKGSIEDQTPTANPDFYRVTQATALTVDTSRGVLANDTDPQDDPLTAGVVTDPNNGAVTLNLDGGFIYTPNPGFTGTDTFSYFASDGISESSTTAATITVGIASAENTFAISEGAPVGALIGPVSPTGQVGASALFQIDDPGIADGLRLLPDDHLSGDRSASTVLIEYLSLQCPLCAAVHPTIAQIEDQFAGDLLVVRRHFPLSVFLANAEEAARAADAAGLQGAFDEMVDRLFGTQSDWSGLADPTGFFETLASELGLDLATFRSDLNDPAVAARVAQDVATAGTLGVSGTPTFFVDGAAIANPAPDDVVAFAAIIQDAIDANEAAFTIDRNRGELFVRNSAAIDFEAIQASVPAGDPVALSVSILVSNVNSARETVTALVNILDENGLPPDATGDSYTATVNNPLDVRASQGVLANDVDPDGVSENLTAALVSDVVNGTLDLNPDGSFAYTPDPGFDGIDTFTYVASDGIERSQVTDVLIRMSASGGAVLSGTKISVDSEVDSVFGDELAEMLDSI